MTWSPRATRIVLNARGASASGDDVFNFGLNVGTSIIVYIELIDAGNCLLSG